MRIAVLSDIHSNLVALDAVLAHAGTVDGVWHLGDVVGYGPDPDGVVARLVEVGAVGVRGNHDAAALGGREIDWFNPEARAAVEWTARRDLAGRPAPGWPPCPNGASIGDVTPRPRQPARPAPRVRLERSTSRRANLARARATTMGLHGHTHVPVAFWPRATGASVDTAGRRPSVGLGDGRRSLVNPGSVGQPRDGDPRSSYLDPGPRGVDA